jgi:2,4-diaminopentanoate dehydrogenase
MSRRIVALLRVSAVGSATAEGPAMRPPYRLIVFGPGGLGAVCIWEAAQSPAFELVGVRAYSAAKEGVDAGTLIGIEPLGVKATTDVQALLKLDCDCVVYTARDMGNFNTDEEILQILASGKNVVTPLPYQQAHLFREKSFVDRLHAACAAGRSVFHATGIDPDLISDRVVLGLTGLCTHIEHLKLQEIWDSDSTDPELLAIVGFGKPPEEAKQSPVAAAVSTNLLKSICYTMEETLGVKYDRVVETHDYVPAPVDIQSRSMLVKAGTVGRVTHRIVGYVASKGAHPFFTMEYNWLLGQEMLPEGVQPNQYWIATIEGRPSVKMVIDIKASLTKQERFYRIGKLRTEPGYHGTIAPCLQAIPLICKAAPGVLPSFGPQLHWRQDLRME